MLAYLDDLDSKIEAMQRLIAEPHAAGDWTRITPMFERPIYRRRTLEPRLPQAKEATVAAASAQPSLPLAAESKVPKEQPKDQQSGSRHDSFNTPFEQLAEWVKE